MAENVQVVLTFTANAELQLPGINQTGWDTQFGAGGDFLGPVLFGTQTWLRLRKLSGDNVFGNRYLNHNYIHWWMDPTSAGPAVVIRLEDMVLMEWGASTVARGFYGFGEFATITDPTSLRGIGFYADSNGNWFALASSAAGDVVRVDSGVAAASAHLLRVELDALAKTITWWVDNVQVATITLVVALGQIASETSVAQGFGIGLWFVQAIQATNEAANMYYAGGWQNQLSFITDIADAAAGAGWAPCDGCN